MWMDNGKLEFVNSLSRAGDPNDDDCGGLPSSDVVFGGAEDCADGICGGDDTGDGWVCRICSEDDTGGFFDDDENGE